MSLEKQLQAFQANVDLIGAKTQSFFSNSTDAGQPCLDVDEPLDSLGVIDAAVRASIRQMRSDLQAVHKVATPGDKEET